MDDHVRSADGLRLRVYDCSRPVRAVHHFMRWAADLGDQRTKAVHYPNLDKRELLGDYIAPTSGHSRGATLDVNNAAAAEALDGLEFDLSEEDFEDTDRWEEVKVNAYRLSKGDTVRVVNAPGVAPAPASAGAPAAAPAAAK